jgi:hypothetical protein
MSRTDTHRPQWVQHRDPTVRPHLVPLHSCGARPCDLEEYFTSDGPPNTKCWAWHYGRRLHGCTLCNQTAERRRMYRAHRTAWRETARQILAARREDMDTVDVLAPRLDRIGRDRAAW